MEKASEEMDLDEWEFLTDDRFLDFSKPVFNPNGIVDMDYFPCPSPGEEFVKDIREVPVVDVIGVPPAMVEKKMIKPELVVEQDPVSQVFFKKKDNEFVDMKLDSPKSNSKGLKPQIEMGLIQFEKKEEASATATQEEEETDEEEEADEDEEEEEEEIGKSSKLGKDGKEKGCLEGGGFAIWKWRITGIGALCSIGVAAATVCIFIIGSHQKHKQQQQNQKLRFQIYTDEKRIKEVVQQATRLNQAISATRGIPLTRANITFGGYYQGI